MSAAADRVKAACITVLGSGFAPCAPGTCGSLVAAALFMLVWSALAGAGAARWSADVVLLAGIAGAGVLSVVWGGWAVARFGHRGGKPTDPRPFVLDEFVGQWVSLLALPLGLAADWWSLACVVGGQFVLFRVFDVLKPPPARRLERLPAGWGILLDDLVAALYANVAGQLLWRLTPVAVWLGVHPNP